MTCRVEKDARDLDSRSASDEWSRGKLVFHDERLDAKQVNNISELVKTRVARAKDRITRAYRHEHGVVPWLVVDTPYWLFGETPETIPDDYFTSVKSQFDHQMALIARHVEAVPDDDYIPLLFPWYGTGVVPSALGSLVEFPPKMDPVTVGAILEKPEDIRKLQMPDPEKDGLMPKVLECIRYMRAHSDLPVSFTDCQGPLNIAISLCGAERLFVWLYEEPRAVHELMDFCTEVLIQWVKVQKTAAGQPLNGGAMPHAIWLPDGLGGVWMSDDDLTAISAQQYREFVVPYNGRVLQAFGGGTIHFCGTAEHQLENLMRTPGIVGVNNFCMGNFRQIHHMQELYKGKLLVMACDFSPVDIAGYYAELLRGLARHGVIVSAYPSPCVALSGGKYTESRRPTAELSRTLRAALKPLG